MFILLFFEIAFNLDKPVFIQFFYVIRIFDFWTTRIFLATSREFFHECFYFFSIFSLQVSDEDDDGDTVGSVLRGFLALKKRDPVNR